MSKQEAELLYDLINRAKQLLKDKDGDPTYLDDVVIK